MSSISQSSVQVEEQQQSPLIVVFPAEQPVPVVVSNVSPAAANMPPSVPPRQPRQVSARSAINQAAHAAEAAAAAVAAPALSAAQLASEIAQAREAVPAGTHITLTRAMGEYCLKKDQLMALQHVLKPNPHYRTAGSPMILFSLRDVVALSLRTHGGQAGLEARRTSKAARSEALKQGRVRRSGDRESELSAALAQQGLKLRSDSWLCDQYLKHGPTHEWPLSAVVRRMGEMKYLHEYTDYRSKLEAVRDNYRMMHERWSPGETEAIAEEEALEVGTGDYPDVWPWLEVRMKAMMNE